MKIVEEYYYPISGIFSKSIICVIPSLTVSSVAVWLLELELGQTAYCAESLAAVPSLNMMTKVIDFKLNGKKRERKK